MKKTQGGRSIVEMLAVLAVIGMIMVGIMVGYSEVTLHFNCARAEREILNIADDVAKAYAIRRGYPPDPVDPGEPVTPNRNETLRAVGVRIPNTTPWGTTYQVETMGDGTEEQDQNPNILRIVLPDLEEDACDELIARSDTWPNIIESQGLQNDEGFYNCMFFFP